jgi:hypothetical protein
VDAQLALSLPALTVPMAPPRRPRQARPTRRKTRPAAPQLELPTSSRWCQRWTGDRRQKWTLADPGERFDARNYEVHRVDRATAAEFVISRHYSRSHVACRQSFGLYRAGALVGVASFCVTSKAALQHAFPELEPGTEALEWGRLVVADPEPGNVESWFGARCMEQLFATGIWAVLSFADPVPRVVDGRVLFAGHAGILYQAGGFWLAGRSEKRTQWLLPDGTFLSGQTMQKIRKRRPGWQSAVDRLVDDFGARPLGRNEDPAGWLRADVRDAPAVGVTLVRHGGCHRYLKILGTAKQRRQIQINPNMVINRELRADWAELTETAPLPCGPYPKTPDPLRPGRRSRR